MLLWLACDRGKILNYGGAFNIFYAGLATRVGRSGSCAPLYFVFKAAELHFSILKKSPLRLDKKAQ
jgi:hypothetical protein